MSESELTRVRLQKEASATLVLREGKERTWYPAPPPLDLVGPAPAFASGEAPPVPAPRIAAGPVCIVLIGQSLLAEREKNHEQED